MVLHLRKELIIEPSPQLMVVVPLIVSCDKHFLLSVALSHLLVGKAGEVFYCQLSHVVKLKRLFGTIPASRISKHRARASEYFIKYLFCQSSTDTMSCLGVLCHRLVLVPNHLPIEGVNLIVSHCGNLVQMLLDVLVQTPL